MRIAGGALAMLAASSLSACDRPVRVEVVGTQPLADAMIERESDRPGRYTALMAPDGFVAFRLDTQTGQMSWCNTHNCFVLSDARAEDATTPDKVGNTEQDAHPPAADHSSSLPARPRFSLIYK